MKEKLLELIDELEDGLETGHYTEGLCAYEFALEVCERMRKVLQEGGDD